MPKSFSPQDIQLNKLLRRPEEPVPNYGGDGHRHHLPVHRPGHQGRGESSPNSPLLSLAQAFLEPINNVLAGGLLSALFSREEQSEIIAELVIQTLPDQSS